MSHLMILLILVLIASVSSSKEEGIQQITTSMANLSISFDTKLRESLALADEQASMRVLRTRKSASCTPIETVMEYLDMAALVSGKMLRAIVSAYLPVLQANPKECQSFAFDRLLDTDEDDQLVYNPRQFGVFLKAFPRNHHHQHHPFHRCAWDEEQEKFLEAIDEYSEKRQRFLLYFAPWYRVVYQGMDDTQRQRARLWVAHGHLKQSPLGFLGSAEHFKAFLTNGRPVGQTVLKSLVRRVEAYQTIDTLAYLCQSKEAVSRLASDLLAAISSERPGEDPLEMCHNEAYWHAFRLFLQAPLNEDFQTIHRQVKHLGETSDPRYLAYYLQAKMPSRDTAETLLVGLQGWSKIVVETFLLAASSPYRGRRPCGPIRKSFPIVWPLPIEELVQFWFADSEHLASVFLYFFFHIPLTQTTVDDFKGDLDPSEHCQVANFHLERYCARLGLTPQFSVR